MSTFFKFFLGVLSTISILIIAFFIFGDSLAEHFIKKRLTKDKQGIYQISVDEIDVSLIGGSLEIQGFKITTDTAIADSSNQTSIKASSQQIVLSGLSFWKLIWDRAFIADSLNLNGIDLQWQQPVAADSSSEKNWREKFYAVDLYSKVKPHFNKVFLQHIIVKEANVAQLSPFTKADTIFTISDLQAHLQGVEIDSGTALTAQRFFHTQKLELKASHFKYSAVKEATNILIELPVISVSDNLLKLNLQNLQAQFARKQLEPLAVKLNDLKIEALNTYQLLNDKSLILEALSMQEAIVNGEIAVKATPTDSGSSLATFSFVPLLKPVFDEIKIERIIVDKAQLQLGESQASNLSISLKDFALDSLPAFSNDRFLHAKSIFLKTDSAQLKVKKGFAAWATAQLSYEQGVGQLTANTVLYKQPGTHILLPHLQLTDFSLNNATNGVSVKQILINKPALVSGLSPSQDDKSGQSALAFPTSFQSFIKPFIHQLRVGNIEIEQARVVLDLAAKGEQLICPTVNLSITDLRIDDNPAFTANRFWHTQHTSLSLEQLIYKYAGGKYQLQLERLALDSEAKQVLINNTSLLTVAKNMNSWYDVPYETAYAMKLDWLSAEGIEWDQFFTQQFVLLDQLTVNKLDFKVYKDRGKHTDVVRPMPQEMLRVPALNYHLKNFQLNKSSITYRERAPEEDTTGIFFVNNIYASAKNISDDRSVLEKYPLLKLNASGRMLGKALVQTESTFDMLNPEMKVLLKGKIDSMDATEFNKIAQYTSPVLIKEGYLIGSWWEFEANKNTSIGTMQLLYKDLDIGVNTGDKDDTSGIFQGLLSGLANALIVEEERRLSEEEVQPVKVKNDRDATLSFMNYYWKTLLVGIKDCIGVPSL